MKEPRVKIAIYVERDEFISAIMGSSWETWEWWHAVDYVDSYDWDDVPAVDTDPFVRILATDQENEWLTIRKTLTVADLVAAFQKLQDGDEYRFSRWDDFDADGADLILQQAVYGSVIWS